MATYSAADVLVTVNGVPITGLVECRVRHGADRYSLQKGIDGTAAYSRLNDDTGEIDIEIMQTSLSNAHLEVIYKLDEAGNAGVVPVVVNDLNSPTTVHAAATARIKKHPDATYGREGTSRVWTFIASKLVSNENGYVNG